MSAKGIFIVFEGIDGSGKSTQLRALQERLQQHGIEPLVIREPGGTPVGEQIRQILLDRPWEMEPLTELLLYEASRSELTRTVLRPALEAGRVVLSDRFALASLAYQSYGRGLDFTLVQKFNTIATDGIEPALTVILDVPVEVALARKRRAFDRLERAGREFHERVRRGYQQLAQQGSNNILLDGTRPASELAEQIWQRVQSLLALTPDSSPLAGRGASEG
jgi:dTMP kinase